jgi:hypothetical protein
MLHSSLDRANKVFVYLIVSLRLAFSIFPIHEAWADFDRHSSPRIHSADHDSSGRGHEITTTKTRTLR